MINKVTLIGNLGRDPEIRHFENGGMVGKFPIATNENYRDKNGEWQTATEWHDIVVWNRLAERAEKSLRKGSLVYIDGKLTHRKYQDKDGIDRYVTEVVANTFRILERREGGGGYGSNFPDEQNVQSKTSGSTYEIKDEPMKQEVSGEAPTEEVDDDLPF